MGFQRVNVWNKVVVREYRYQSIFKSSFEEQKDNFQKLGIFSTPLKTNLGFLK
jgi:hypothetical protein